MVHVEDAPVTGRAVMAAFRLENVAHEAVTAALLLWITQMKAPKNWNLARVSCHSLNERPECHKEDKMETDKH